VRYWSDVVVPDVLGAVGHGPALVVGHRGGPAAAPQVPELVRRVVELQVLAAVRLREKA
jgi:hypothetical protein